MGASCECGNPSRAAGLAFFCAERKLGKMGGGYRWECVRVRESKDFSAKAETSFASEIHGVFEKLKEREGNVEPG